MYDMPVKTMLGTPLNPRVQNARDYTHSILKYSIFILGFGYGSVGTK